MLLPIRRPWAQQPGLAVPRNDVLAAYTPEIEGALSKRGTVTTVATPEGLGFSAADTGSGYDAALTTTTTANKTVIFVGSMTSTLSHGIAGLVQSGGGYGAMLYINGSGQLLYFNRDGANLALSGLSISNQRCVAIGSYDGATVRAALRVIGSGQTVYGEKSDTGSTSVPTFRAGPIFANGTFSTALSAVLSRALGRAEMQELLWDPWQLFEQRRIWVPVAAAGGSPVTSTSSLSVAVQKARTAAASAGLAIQAPHTATASASAAVQHMQAAEASLQAAVQQAQQATASVSVAAQAAGTESASLQAAIQQARAATSSLNAYLQAGSSMVADVDLAVQQGRAVTASASIAARVQQALAADLSLAARQARSAAASLSMSIQGATATTVTADLNVAVQELLTAAVAVNMAMQTMRTASAALSAYLIMRRTVSAAMSTAAQAARNGTAGLSLYVQGAEVVQPLSAPPAKQRLQSSSRGANLQTSRRPVYRGGSR